MQQYLILNALRFLRKDFQSKATPLEEGLPQYLLNWIQGRHLVQLLSN